MDKIRLISMAGSVLSFLAMLVTNYATEKYIDKRVSEAKIKK